MSWLVKENMEIILSIRMAMNENMTLLDKWNLLTHWNSILCLTGPPGSIPSMCCDDNMLEIFCFMQTPSVPLQIKIWTSCGPKLLLQLVVVIIITFTSETCNDVRARDPASVREKGTRSDCYITPPPPPNTGKVLFVKLLHFKQNFVVFLLLFVVFPSFLLLSVSPNFP